MGAEDRLQLFWSLPATWSSNGIQLLSRWESFVQHEWYSTCWWTLSSRRLLNKLEKCSWVVLRYLQKEVLRSSIKQAMPSILLTIWRRPLQRWVLPAEQNLWWHAGLFRSRYNWWNAVLQQGRREAKSVPSDFVIHLKMFCTSKKKILLKQDVKLYLVWTNVTMVSAMIVHCNVMVLRTARMELMKGIAKVRAWGYMVLLPHNFSDNRVNHIKRVNYRVGLIVANDAVRNC